MKSKYLGNIIFVIIIIVDVNIQIMADRVITVCNKQIFGFFRVEGKFILSKVGT